MTNLVQSMFDGPQLVPSALRGYRTWGGLSPTNQLESTSVNHLWPPAPFRGAGSTGLERAECLDWDGTGRKDHGAPDGQCQCGIYGWYAPADSRIVPRPVFGAIEASGRVLLGSHGFRAETVTVLGVTADSPVLLKRLIAAGYPTWPSRAQLLKAFPPEDVSGLTGHVCGGSCPAADSLLVDAVTRLRATWREVTRPVAATARALAGLWSPHGGDR